MQCFVPKSWGTKSIVIPRGRIKRLPYCFGQHKQQDKQKHYMCLNINSYQSAKDRQCNNTYCGMFHAEKVNKVKQTNQKATQNNKASAKCATNLFVQQGTFPNNIFCLGNHQETNRTLFERHVCPIENGCGT